MCRYLQRLWNYERRQPPSSNKDSPTTKMAIQNWLQTKENQEAASQEPFQVWTTRILRTKAITQIMGTGTKAWRIIAQRVTHLDFWVPLEVVACTTVLARLCWTQNCRCASMENFEYMRFHIQNPKRKVEFIGKIFTLLTMNQCIMLIILRIDSINWYLPHPFALNLKVKVCCLYTLYSIS